MTKNKIRGTGRHYADGLEAMEIAVTTPPLQAQPREGCRVSLNIRIGSEDYLAGMRSTTKAGIWICPDLRDSSGRKISLAKALLKNGFTKNQPVRFSQKGDLAELSPG